jgi:hypothetical protein
MYLVTANRTIANFINSSQTILLQFRPTERAAQSTRRSSNVQCPPAGPSHFRWPRLSHGHFWSNQQHGCENRERRLVYRRRRSALVRRSLCGNAPDVAESAPLPCTFTFSPRGGGEPLGVRGCSGGVERARLRVQGVLRGQDYGSKAYYDLLLDLVAQGHNTPDRVQWDGQIFTCAFSLREKEQHDKDHYKQCPLHACALSFALALEFC